MNSDRMSNLARMVAHPDRVKTIRNDDIIKKFVDKNPRKLEFNFKGRTLYICLTLMLGMGGGQSLFHPGLQKLPPIGVHNVFRK